MNRILTPSIVIAAGGMLLALIEMLLPLEGARDAAKAAIGILFLELLAEQIAGIFR